MPTLTDVMIYQLKVVLLGISPMIWRRLLVRGDSTIADLHYSSKSLSGGPIPTSTSSASKGKSTELPRSEASASVTTPIRCSLQTLASGWVNVSSTTMTLGTTGSTSSVSKPSAHQSPTAAIPSASRANAPAHPKTVGVHGRSWHCGSSTPCFTSPSGWRTSSRVMTAAHTSKSCTTFGIG